jgi:hypothetical protein
MQLLPLLNLEEVTLVCGDGGRELSRMADAAQDVLGRSLSPSKCLEVFFGSEERTIVIRDKPS